MKKYTYDAFISYSHNEKDAFAAEQLHKTLEHYHIPKRIQQSSGKKKIERVFRDREEMPISFNLASNIQEALDQSEFLILMCSPNSIKSEWVQREVETFLKSHSKEQVLTVLLEGEPEKVFPEVLCYEERKVELNRWLQISGGKIRVRSKRRSSRKASGFWQRCWGVLMIHCDSGTGNMHFTE